MSKLTTQQVKSLNALIAKELERSGEPFLYSRDLKKQLVRWLENRVSKPFRTWVSLTRYFGQLEDEGRLYLHPYLYREEKGEQWRFYKLDTKPINRTEFVDQWVIELKETILTNGVVQIGDTEVVPDPNLPGRIVNAMSNIPGDYYSEAYNSGLREPDYFGRILEENPNHLHAEELAEYIDVYSQSVRMENRHKFFKLNLGENTEDTPLNKKHLIGRLLSEAFEGENESLQQYGNLFYLEDTVNIVHDVPSYLTAIKKVSRKSKGEVFYRGQGKFHWKDIPSLYRNGDAPEQEHRLFKEIILKNPEEFINHHTTFEKLTKMQHYELPTRLMDITSNPLVALYFAVSNPDHDNDPSEVILYECETEKIKYYDSDHVSVIANLAQRKKEFGFLSSTLDEIEAHEESGYAPEIADNFVIPNFNLHPETVYLHHTIRGEKPYFEPKINPRHLNSSVIVKSKLDNERIKKQDGAFIIVGINRYTPNEPAPIDFYLKNKQEKRVRVIIAETDEDGRNVAKVIREELDTLSYNRGSLFPEIMNSAQYIKDRLLRR